jgi:hypothetical protein
MPRRVSRARRHLRRGRIAVKSLTCGFLVVLVGGMVKMSWSVTRFLSFREQVYQVFDAVCAEAAANMYQDVPWKVFEKCVQLLACQALERNVMVQQQTKLAHGHDDAQMHADCHEKEDTTPLTSRSNPWLSSPCGYHSQTGTLRKPPPFRGRAVRSKKLQQAEAHVHPKAGVIKLFW